MRKTIHEQWLAAALSLPTKPGDRNIDGSGKPYGTTLKMEKSFFETTKTLVRVTQRGNEKRRVILNGEIDVTRR